MENNRMPERELGAGYGWTPNDVHRGTCRQIEQPRCGQREPVSESKGAGTTWGGRRSLCWVSLDFGFVFDRE